MALQPFVGPWPLFQFLNLFIQTVGLLGRVISSSQGRYLHTGQHKHRINACTHQTFHALNGIRNHDPGFRASVTVHALDRSATVAGDPKCMGPIK
jgi:hypothetical protein